MDETKCSIIAQHNSLIYPQGKFTNRLWRRKIVVHWVRIFMFIMYQSYSLYII